MWQPDHREKKMSNTKIKETPVHRQDKMARGWTSTAVDFGKGSYPLCHFLQVPLCQKPCWPEPSPPLPSSLSPSRECSRWEGKGQIENLNHHFSQAPQRDTSFAGPCLKSMEVSKVDVCNCKQGYFYLCCLGIFYYHPSKILKFFSSLFVPITREKMNTGNRVVHTTRQRADPRWI